MTCADSYPLRGNHVAPAASKRTRLVRYLSLASTTRAFSFGAAIDAGERAPTSGDETNGPMSG